MNDISAAIINWLDRMFDGCLPGGNDQPSATAFAGALTFSLAPSTTCTPILYCAPHSPLTKHLLADHLISFVSQEWLVDFVVVEQESATKRLPLIACESEMHPSHGVGYSFDIVRDGGGNVYPKDGYVWDFCKLLHFPAPHLLFAAQLPDVYMGRLEDSLRACAREYRSFWENRRLTIVLLPSATRRRSRIRLGAGNAAGELHFENLTTES